MSREKGDLILAINGGSSSIKFALFAPADGLRRIAKGHISGIGSDQGEFNVTGNVEGPDSSRSVTLGDHKAAIDLLVDWIDDEKLRPRLRAAGHRIVQGGPSYNKPIRVTAEVIADLRQLISFDPQHLPHEILLLETFHARFPELAQVACFDTAFHHALPKVAQLLPIPRRYFAKGVRRYGFHGLSYTYLMEELERVAGTQAASGKIILAHLGSGASLAAVDRGQPVDTSMAFTPAAGLPMSTRSGDLDPGLAWYLAETEQMDAKQFNEMVNKHSGLLGTSETSSDMQELLAREGNDTRAAEAVTLFCYSVKKWIGSFAAALGGLDTLVFAGGIGEKGSAIRERVCGGLEFLGIELDLERNAQNAALISTDAGRVQVRVIPTDEEVVIAKSVTTVLQLEATNTP